MNDFMLILSCIYSDVFVNGGRLGGKGLKTVVFAFNKPVHFSSSAFVAVLRFIWSKVVPFLY